jgi:hypothetical protein
VDEDRWRRIGALFAAVLQLMIENDWCMNNRSIF